MIECYEKKKTKKVTVGLGWGEAVQPKLVINKCL